MDHKQQHFIPNAFWLLLHTRFVAEAVQSVKEVYQRRVPSVTYVFKPLMNSWADLNKNNKTFKAPWKFDPCLVS